MRFADAASSMQQAISLAGDPPWTWRLALLNVLRDQGRLREAGALGEALVAEVPDRAEIRNAHGLTLRAQGAMQDAVASFRKAIAINPRHVSSYVNAAAALDATGDGDSAVTLLQQGLVANPGASELHVALGKAYDTQRLPDLAQAAYGNAIRMKPKGSFHALYRFGRIAYEQADIFTAIRAYEAGLELVPGDVELWIWLGNAYLDVGAIAQATRAFERALELQPGYAEVYDNLLVTHHYNPRVDPQAMYEAHVEWQRRFAPSAPDARPSRRAVSRARDRIRLGFVSSSLRRGAVPYFLRALAVHLDREAFAVHWYDVAWSTVGENLAAHRADERRPLIGCSDEELVHAIRADGIDVLVDLDGHVPGNRLRALAHKPAPVQVTWLDYFDTTGTPAFDYLVADSVSVPPGGTQQFVEQVVRLDPCRLCYSPPAYAPQPSPPPASRNGFVTFGSFNRLSKYAEPLLDQWAALLKAVPASRLVLKNGAFAHPTTRQVFAQRFVLRGIDAARLDLRGPSDHAQMLREYGDVDIALDTSPYNGGLTTCEALFMGVPVVGMCGDSMISRQSAALLGAAGLTPWIAETQAQWLDINTRIAESPGERVRFRTSAREELARTPFMDQALFARRFASLVLGMSGGSG